MGVSAVFVISQRFFGRKAPSEGHGCGGGGKHSFPNHGLWGAVRPETLNQMMGTLPLCIKMSVGAYNTYLSNTAKPNFNSNVADISKFFDKTDTTSYDNMNENQLNTIDIKENYSLPPAPDLRVLDDITVQLRIFVKPDGTINRTIVNKSSLIRAKEDPIYLPYVEAAQRAIRKLGKFSKLPEEEYNLWKIIDISFTPYQT